MMSCPCLPLLCWSCFSCSDGKQALSQLAANPAVRELLIKPLAMKHASINRYAAAVDTRLPSTQEEPAEEAAAVAADAATTTASGSVSMEFTAPSVVVVARGASRSTSSTAALALAPAEDLSGDGMAPEDFVAPEDGGGGKGLHPLANMQRLASLSLSIVQETFAM